MSKKHAMPMPTVDQVMRAPLPQAGSVQWESGGTARQQADQRAALETTPAQRAEFLDQRSRAVAEFEGTPLQVTVSTLGGRVLTTLIAEPKHFSTGSRGFYATGKVTFGPDAAKYQVSATLVRVGSKAAQ